MKAKSWPRRTTEAYRLWVEVELLSQAHSGLETGHNSTEPAFGGSCHNVSRISNPVNRNELQNGGHPGERCRGMAVRCPNPSQSNTNTESKGKDAPCKGGPPVPRLPTGRQSQLQRWCGKCRMPRSRNENQWAEQTAAIGAKSVAGLADLRTEPAHWVLGSGCRQDTALQGRRCSKST